MIEYAARHRTLAFEQDLHEAFYDRHIAADTDRQVQIGEFGRFQPEHAKWIAVLRVRIDKARQTDLGQRINGDHPGSGCFGGGKRREHSRRIRSGILPDDDNKVCLFKILKAYRCLPEADRLGESDARRFVTHI